MKPSSSFLISIVAISSASAASQAPNARNLTLARTGAAQTIDIASQVASPTATPLTIVSLGSPSRGSAMLNADGTVSYIPDTTPFRQFRIIQADLAPGGAQPQGDADIYSVVGAAPNSPLIGFGTSASNLLPINPTGIDDGYLYDLRSGKIDWVTPTYNMQQPNRSTLLDAISGNGQFVVFETAATNMLPSSVNTNSQNQVYIFDRATQSLDLVSLDLSGNPANGYSTAADISLDGTTIAFTSFGTNLVNLSTGTYGQVYVRDLVTGVTRIASVNSSGQPGTGGDSGDDDSISGAGGSSGHGLRRSSDGRYAAFPSFATNLVPSGLTSGVKNIFVHDFQTGSTVAVSVDQNGIPGTTNSFEPFLSSDGTKVAFYSTAPLIGETHVAGSDQTYIRNLTGNPTTSRVISGYDGAELNTGGVWDFFPTADLRYFAYNTQATNAVANASFQDQNLHCYVLDTTTNTVVPVDVNADGSPITANASPNTAPTFPPGCQKVTVTSDGTYALIVEQPKNGPNVLNYIVTKSDQFTYTARDQYGNFISGTITLTAPLTQ